MANGKPGAGGPGDRKKVRAEPFPEDVTVYEKPKKNGSKKNLDIEKIGAFCRTKPSLLDCAYFFEVSIDTMEDFVEEQTGMKFSEFRDKNVVHSRHALIRNAMRQSLKEENPNPAIMIFTLKNVAGWTDKIALSNDEQKPFKLAYDPNNMKVDDEDR